MSNQAFQIGQSVYYAGASQHGLIEKPCPLCFGNLFVQVILGNGEIQSVECSACGLGFEGPRGCVNEREATSWVKSGVVTGISQQRNGAFRYEIDSCSWNTSDMFATEAEAEARRVVLHAQAQADAMETNEHIMREKKKGFAWSVRYHGDIIRKLERDLEWHREKLLISKEKAARRGQ